jgi:hypothetical protein
MAFLDLIIYRKLLKKIDICASILGVGGVGFGLFEVSDEYSALTLCRMKFSIGIMNLDRIIQVIGPILP